MSQEENKHHLSSLENQGIDGKTVMGGGTSDLGLTADNSNLSGMVSEQALSDAKPVMPEDSVPMDPILPTSPGGPVGPTGGLNPPDGYIPADLK